MVSKKTQTTEKIKIKDGKIAVPSFKYRKASEKFKKTYAERKLDIPDRQGGIVRIYLDSDGAVITRDGPEHELILAEFTIPHDEYEVIEKKVKGKTIEERKKKPVDFSKVIVKNFDIPDRS